jgi:hypothetical protein
MTSTKTLARIAGALYLVMAVCAGFAELYVRSRIVESGDAVATADNIRASPRSSASASWSTWSRPPSTC